MLSVRVGLCLRKGSFRFSGGLDVSSLVNPSLTLPTSALSTATRYDSSSIQSLTFTQSLLVLLHVLN